MNNKGGRLHFAITADNEDVKRKLAETRQGIINSGKAAEEQGSKIEEMFKRAALAAGAFFTVQQAASFAKQIAVVRGEFQQLEVAFTTMLGSASKGKAMMQEAVEIAAKTPFDLKGVAQGAKQLLAYGSSSQDVGKELVMLGNIAAGLSIPLNDMVYLYGTTQTQGRLFTQDLRQFMGRGIPLADELAKQFGVTKERVGELVTAGKVGFPEVQKALQAMTADGGKFNNLMEEQSKTITGQISNLGDSIDVMFNKIGTSQEGLISDIIGGATSLVENYEKVGREIGALVVTYGAYKAAVISFAAVQKTVTTIKHTEEAAELAKLLTVEQQSNISKLGLAKTSAEYAAAVKSEVVAEMEKQTQLAVTTNAELEASQVRLASAEGAKKRAAENVATRQAELASVIGVAKAEQISVLEKKIAIESEKQSRAALEVVKLQSRKNDAISQAQHLKEIEASTEKIAAKNREIAVIAEKIAVSKAEEVQCSRNIVSLRAEKLALNDSIASKATLKAQAALETAQQELNTSSLARNAAAREVSSKRAVIDSAVRRANTLEMGVNTASQAANATATGFLSVAKIKLTAITAKLNAVIMANPYTIAAVAIAALAYGIYKLCTAQSAAEKAQEAFNEKIEDGKKKQDEFVSKTNELIGVIRTETNTRYMRTKAFKELNDKYPGLLKNMSMEKLLLMDNLELQKLISQYTENESKKELFAGLDGATKDLATAKQALDNYVSNSSKGTGGTSIFEVWRLDGNIEEAEESLKLWQDKLKEHRQIEADARPVDVKIADLSQNITLLENQLAEIQRLQDEAKKNNPYGWNLYEFQIGAINAQISAEQGELKALNEGNSAQKEQDKNKAYWETQKKNAQDALEAMGEAAKGGEKWNEAVAKINQASSKLKQWDVSGKGDAKDANTLKKLAQEITSNQLNLEDEKIAILEDGRTKRLALSEQELAEKKAILKKEYDETVAEYKKLGKVLPKEVITTYNQRIEVANTAKTTRDTEINKDADKELQEHQKAITDVFLNEESKRLATIKERYDKEREWADAQFKGGNMTAEQRDNYKSGVDKSQQYEELESLLKEYQTYADKRKEIEEKFNSEIATLQSKNEGGKYDAQIKQAEKNKKQALSSVNFEEAKEGIDFTQLFGNLDNLTLPSQKELRNKIKAWIDTASKDLSPEDLKAVSDAFNKLDLNIADKDPFSVLKSSISDYKTAVKEVDEAQKVYNETLEKYKKDSDEAKKAAEALTAANNKKAASVEKANEAIHSVADKGQQIVGAATDVMNIMGDLGIKVPEEIAGAIDGVGQMMDGLASIDLTKPLSIVTGGIKMIGGLVKSITSVFNGDNKKEKEIQKSQKQINALEKSYHKLDDAINKAYSTDASKLIGQQNELLKQQKVLIQNQIASERSKKNTDNGKIDAWQKQIDEIDKTLSDNKIKAQDAIFGADVKSAIDEFANAYANAWASGEDRAKAMKGVVKNMIKGVVVEMLKSDLAPTIKKIRDEIESMLVDGVIDDYEQSRLDNIIEGATSNADKKYGWADKYLKGDEDEKGREASSKGFTSMSQDSADELNGRFTAMQGMLFDVKEAQLQMLGLQKQNLPQLQHLTHLSAISENTAYCRRLEGIEKDMSSMKNDINTIVIKGITIKK